jgi:hypothetical protein
MFHGVIYTEAKQISLMDQPSSTPPTRCYASPSVVLPYTPLLVFSLSVHMNVGSDNHLMTLIVTKSPGPLDVAQREPEGGVQQ